MKLRGRLTPTLGVLAIWAIAAGPAAAAPGELDPSFGNGGISELPDYHAEDVSDIALQPDGRILVAGTYLGPTDPNRDTYVARLLNPQGTLDPAYGLGSGWSRLNFGDPDQGGGLVLRSNGSIQVSGVTTTSGPGGGRRFVIAQLLNPQGTLDPAFGSGTGFLVDRYNSLGVSADADASLAAAAQGSSTIIAGYSVHSAKTDYAVARINSAGVQDGSFAAGSGVSYVDFLNGDDVARDVAVQSDGRIVLMGVTGPGSSGGYIGVARLTANGGLDNSFNGNGLALVQGSGDAVAIQPDGKIVVVGSSGGDFIIARFDSDGTLDSSFGSGGRAFVDFGGLIDTANDVKLQPDGKILVAGEGPEMDVARLQPNGALDTTFGKGGKTAIDFGELGAQGYALALQPDGKTVVAGTGYHSAGGKYLGLARLQADPPGSVSAKCAGKKATIVGTNGKNKLKGTKRKDVISAGGGKDTVKGLKGNDLICGGKGKDKLVGGPGKDKLLGQQGKDKLLGGPGNDKLLGGPGKDKLKGGPGKKDKLNGGPGKDSEKP